MSDEHAFLLQRVQPAMVGLIDGSLSTLAPIFAVVLASHDTRFAFIAGLATSIGAAISMGFSEALSDTGELTGRGSPWSRGLITGGGTFLGGILHSLPFLISDYRVALFFAVAVVAFELLALAYFRYRFFQDTFIRALGLVTFAGVLIVAISAGLGSLLGAPVGGWELGLELAGREVAHLGGAAGTGAELDDPRVAARPVRHPRANLGEQLV